MQLAIAQNPHIKEHKLIWEELDRQENSLMGREYLDAEFDNVGFELLKQKLRENPRFVVK